MNITPIIIHMAQFVKNTIKYLQKLNKFVTEITLDENCFY